MTHQFRPRKPQDGQGQGQGRRRGRGGREGLPKIDNQTDLESLPEIDYNHFDQMTPAALLKEAKAAKLSPNLLRHELIEQLLEEANPECSYARGVLDLLNDGWGFLRRDNYLPANSDVYVSQTQVKRYGLRAGDGVYGFVRQPKEGEKFHGMLRVESVNTYATGSEEMKHRKN